MKTHFVFVPAIFLLVCSACSEPRVEVRDAEAYYTRGMERVWDGGQTTLRETIGEFEQCIEIDSTHAGCHAGLAIAYSVVGVGHNILSEDEARTPAREAARRAIALDDASVLAHIAMGEVFANVDWDWPAAEKEFLRALELDPKNFDALGSYAWFLGVMGRADDSSRYTSHIYQLFPEIPIWMARLDYMNTGNAAPSLEKVEAAIASNPGAWSPYWIAGVILGQEGQFERAAQRFEQQMPLMEEGDVVDEVTMLGFVYGKMGREKEARAMLARLDELAAEGRSVSPCNRACIHAGLGDADRTIELLEEGVAARSNFCIEPLRTMTYMFDPMRTDPRFGAILAEMGFSE